MISKMISKVRATYAATLACLQAAGSNAQVAELVRDIAAIKRTLPPEGWSPSGYTCLADPRLFAVRDPVTGIWSVWGDGIPVSTHVPTSGTRSAASGLTLEEAIALVPSTRLNHPREVHDESSSP